MVPKILALTVLVLAACGSKPHEHDTDAAPPPADARAPDAAGPADAAPTPTPPHADVVSATGQLSGGVYHLDVEIGTPTSQDTLTGGATTLSSGAAIVP